MHSMFSGHLWALGRGLSALLMLCTAGALQAFEVTNGIRLDSWGDNGGRYDTVSFRLADEPQLSPYGAVLREPEYRLRSFSVAVRPSKNGTVYRITDEMKPGENLSVWLTGEDTEPQASQMLGEPEQKTVDGRTCTVAVFRFETPVTIRRDRVYTVVFSAFARQLWMVNRDGLTGETQTTIHTNADYDRFSPIVFLELESLTDYTRALSAGEAPWSAADSWKTADGKPAGKLPEAGKTVSVSLSGTSALNADVSAALSRLVIAGPGTLTLKDGSNRLTADRTLVGADTVLASGRGETLGTVKIMPDTRLTTKIGVPFKGLDAGSAGEIVFEVPTAVSYSTYGALPNQLRDYRGTVIFRGPAATEPSTSFSYGTEDAGEFHGSFVYEGGEHALTYGRGGNSGNNVFAADGMYARPSVWVKNDTKLTFTMRDLSGWSGSTAAGGVLRVSPRGELVLKQDGSKSGFFRNVLWLDGAPSAEAPTKLTVTGSDTYLNLFGGTDKAQAQLRMPPTEAASFAEISGAQLNTNGNGAAMDIGARATLRVTQGWNLNQPLTKYGAGVWHQAANGLPGSGAVTVAEGTLRLKRTAGRDITVGGPLEVRSGAVLEVPRGGALQRGGSTAVTSVSGTLRGGGFIGGNVTLDSGAELDLRDGEMQLGVPAAGAVQARNGTLTLTPGTLTVRVKAAPASGASLTLMSFAEGTDGTLKVGSESVPDGEFLPVSAAVCIGDAAEPSALLYGLKRSGRTLVAVPAGSDFRAELGVAGETPWSSVTADSAVGFGSPLTVASSADGAVLAFDRPSVFGAVTADGTQPVKIAVREPVSMASLTVRSRTEIVCEGRGTLKIGSVSVQRGGTLVLHGGPESDLSDAELSVEQGGCLEIASGRVKVTFAGAEALKGNLKVAAGAALCSATADAVQYEGAGQTFDIFGTLDVQHVRWTLPDGLTFNLHEGAVLKGTADGDAHGFAYDFWKGSGLTVLGNARIEGHVGAHVSGATVPVSVASGRTLTVTGELKGGDTAYAVSGGGTLRLDGANRAGGTLTVSDAILCGSGSWAGALTLNEAASLDASAGVLSVRGAVTLPDPLTVRLTPASVADGAVTALLTLTGSGRLPDPLPALNAVGEALPEGLVTAADADRRVLSVRCAVPQAEGADVPFSEAAQSVLIAANGGRVPTRVTVTAKGVPGYEAESDSALRLFEGIASPAADGSLAVAYAFGVSAMTYVRTDKNDSVVLTAEVKSGEKSDVRFAADAALEAVSSSDLSAYEPVAGAAEVTDATGVSEGRRQGAKRFLRVPLKAEDRVRTFRVKVTERPSELSAGTVSGPVSGNVMNPASQSGGVLLMTLTPKTSQTRLDLRLGGVGVYEGQRFELRFPDSSRAPVQAAADDSGRIVFAAFEAIPANTRVQVCAVRCSGDVTVLGNSWDAAGLTVGKTVPVQAQIANKPSEDFAYEPWVKGPNPGDSRKFDPTWGVYRIPGVATDGHGEVIAVYDLRWLTGQDINSTTAPREDFNPKNPGPGIGHRVPIDMGESYSANHGHAWRNPTVGIRTPHKWDPRNPRPEGKLLETIDCDFSDPCIVYYPGSEVLGKEPCYFVMGITGAGLGNNKHNGLGFYRRGVGPDATWERAPGFPDNQSFETEVFRAMADAGSVPGCTTPQQVAEAAKSAFQGPGHGFVTSVGNEKMPIGTIVFPMQWFPAGKDNSASRSFAIYSRDGGDTWHATKMAPDAGSQEDSVTELDDGSWYMISKDDNGRSGRQRFHYRTTDFANWVSQGTTGDTTAIQASILRLGTKDGIGRYAMAEAARGGGEWSRDRLRLYFGKDNTRGGDPDAGAIVWDRSNPVMIYRPDSGFKLYNSMCLLDGGKTLGILYEADTHIYFTRIDISDRVDAVPPAHE